MHCVMLHSVCRLYVLCHVILCLQTDCMYCVMLHSVCRLYVLCHVILYLQTDCMYCVMLHSVCRQTVCTVSCYTVYADRLYALCHVILCLQTDCMYCVMLYCVCRQTVCTVSCYTVSADRLNVLCHVILYKNTVIKIITFFSAWQFSEVIYTQFQYSLPMRNSINCMVPCHSNTPSPKEHQTQPKNLLKYLSYLLLYQPVFRGFF
jgi:hypothetical protein